MIPRIGSLFTGTGALDLAVQDVYGGDLVWHSQFEPPDKHGKPDRHQWPAQILHRHWPTVPNLGDITAIDWHAVLEEHGPVDILTGGFPCQDISSAGKRAGLVPGTRSGLWAHMARAISVLRPRLLVIENVEGLLSRKAHRDLGPDSEALDEGTAGGTLRALGAVLGDLATLRFDAEWARVAASEVGAPHGRKRVFICAWPATEDADRAARGERRIAAPGQTQERGARADAGRRGRAPAANTDGGGRDRHPQRDSRTVEPRLAAPQRVDAVGRRVQRATPADTHGFGRGPGELDVQPGQPDTEWGAYGPAIRRWEHVLGRRAPRPVDDLGRLSPAFTEWMMGLPAGWVVDTPGITRPAALKALGNGVVRQQAAAALRLLQDRMPAAARLAPAGQPALERAA
ncbi:DNA cytosine methyltransferase [Streptomyces sp. NPDC007025]|uniref:DNA cytosine methyltransferase n=1 Tax=Streptomyces sp. NPDC007025 TaxID=3364771 RepID=UPI0036A0A2CE